jgi:hypothetical protein
MPLGAFKGSFALFADIVRLDVIRLLKFAFGIFKINNLTV